MRVNAKNISARSKPLHVYTLMYDWSGSFFYYFLLFLVFFNGMSKFQVHPSINDCHVERNVTMVYTFLIVEYIILARAVCC